MWKKFDEAMKSFQEMSDLMPEEIELARKSGKTSVHESVTYRLNAKTFRERVALAWRMLRRGHFTITITRKESVK